MIVKQVAPNLKVFKLIPQPHIRLGLLHQSPTHAQEQAQEKEADEQEPAATIVHAPTVAWDDGFESVSGSMKTNDPTRAGSAPNCKSSGIG
jgi:hypothetical protein